MKLEEAADAVRKMLSERSRIVAVPNWREALEECITALEIAAHVDGPNATADNPGGALTALARGNEGLRKRNIELVRELAGLQNKFDLVEEEIARLKRKTRE